MFNHLSTRERLGYVLIVALFLFAVGFIGAQKLRRPAQIVFQSPSPSADVVVDVSGEVNKPGVLKLQPGARVQDALNAAGGAKPDADLQAINQAEIAYDGQKIFVPSKSAPTTTAATVKASSNGPRTYHQKVLPTEPISINHATLDQLESLPGCGPVMAQRILDYRSSNGPFSTIEGLRQVKGIGDKKFAKLKPYIKL